MFALRASTKCLTRSSLNRSIRTKTTLLQNPHIHVFPTPTGHLLTLLPTSPPTPRLAIGTSTTIPVAPDTFAANPVFAALLNDVLAEWATRDPGVQDQAKGFVSSAGGVFAKEKKDARGGWVHLSDSRQVPDWGRIAWPEDILGSVEVDKEGNVVEGGWQPSGTYRLVTREGILGLSDFLRGKVVEKLREEERKQ